MSKKYKMALALMILVGLLAYCAGRSAAPQVSVTMPPEGAAANLGDGWELVSKADAKAYAEDIDDSRDWAECVVHVGDTTVIACPDGHVETS